MKSTQRRTQKKKKKKKKKSSAAAVVHHLVDLKEDDSVSVFAFVVVASALERFVLPRRVRPTDRLLGCAQTQRRVRVFHSFSGC